MKKPLILVTHPLPEVWLEEYQNRYDFIVGPEHQSGISDELRPYFKDVEGVLLLLCDPIRKCHIELMPNLKVISNMAAGTDNIDLGTCMVRGIQVGNTPGVLTNATADLTMALLLSLIRNIATAAVDAKEGKWQMWEPAQWLGIDLSGKTMGIYGLGKIGTAVAKRASAFGMNIIYYNRNRNIDAEQETQAKCVEFEQLLAQSDILSIHAPLNAESKKKFDQNAFEKMKKSAILINVGRGQIVDSEDLAAALSQGQIKAAGLDVTDPEPLPPGHILYQLPNCLVLPHIGSATIETRRKMARMAMDNIEAGLFGKQLPYAVHIEN
jgi:glyoxylate reductase